MNKVDQYRRKLIGGIAVGCLSPHSLVQAAVINDDSELLPTTPTQFLSAQGSSSNNYSLNWFKQSAINSVKSNFRGHGVAVNPDHKTAILFARRPGTQGIEVDLSNAKIINTFHCSPGFHLTGHGCFSHDGRYLITSESNYKTGQGHVVIRDTKQYRIQAVYPSFGIGPHEIKLLNKQNTLVIANGGILTHPDSGRKKLNLDTMRPNLTYLDLNTGERIQSIEYNEPKASIRHFDIHQDDTVIIGMQMQRPKSYHDRTIPLCATHKIGDHNIQPLKADARIYDMLNDYTGSVCVSSKHQLAGFTSPRGNLAIFFDLKKRQLISAFSLQDVCGIALERNENHFVLSNANGHLRYIHTNDLTENISLRHTFKGKQFDNHLIALAL